MSNEISEVTRLTIADFLTVSGIDWCGRFTDDEFLARFATLKYAPKPSARQEAQ